MLKSRIIYSSLVALIVSLLFAVELQYIVTYVQMNSLFLFDGDYLTHHLSSVTLPGKYISDFIAQFFYYPMLGAAIMGLIYGVSFYCFTSSSRNSDPFMLAVPILIYLLIGYLHADFMQLSTTLLLCAIVLKLWSVIHYKIRLVATLPLAAMLYYFVGIYCLPVMLFMVARLVSDAPKRGYALCVIPLTLIMASIPYIVCYLCLYPSRLAYSAGLTTNHSSTNLLWFGLITIYIVYTTFLPRRWFEHKTWRWISGSMFAAFVIAGSLAIRSVSSADMNTILRMEQAAAEEQWTEVLRLNRESPKMRNKLKSVLTNVALFRTGALTEQLLDYDQSFGEQGLFFRWEPSSQVSINNNDLVYANVGLINEAFKYCFESWESRKVHINYRKLITYSEILGKVDFTTKFRNNLDKSLFYAHDAHRLTFSPSKVATCNEDYIINNISFTENLKAVFNADSTNYAAFDYLAASYLLSNQVTLLAQLIPWAVVRYNGTLPRLYQEALVVLSMVRPELFTELNYKIDESIGRRFQNFNQTVFGSKSANPRANAENSYGNSYWFYLSFVSPHGSEIR